MTFNILMEPNVKGLFEQYGITGVAALDTIIIVHFLPFIITYITLFLEMIKIFITTFLWTNIYKLYKTFKNKVFGQVEFRLCVTQETSIYPTIRSIFFSDNLHSNPDNIDTKKINILNLVTESKFDKDDKNNLYYDEPIIEMHDLVVDSSNAINIEKRTDFGTSISKKYFVFKNYHIVVSENKKTDFSRMWKKYSFNTDDKNESTKKDEQNKNVELFILFEAIPITNSKSNKNIVSEFLFERFKLNIRLPHKYTVKICNKIISNKLSNCYNKRNPANSELIMSDGFKIFFTNPSVKEFYSNEFTNISGDYEPMIKTLSNSTKTIYSASVFNRENMVKDLHFHDTSTLFTNKMFGTSIKEIIKYFFGSTFKVTDICSSSFFYLRNNKIIIFLSVYNSKKDEDETYLCIVSFQELLVESTLLDIFNEMIDYQINIIIDPTEKEKCVDVFNYINNTWKRTICESRSYNTIFLPHETKQLVTSEMNKFISFEKVYKATGIPYKKGFLFYGPPGTGKTSLVKAIAHTYNIPIFIFDINNGSVNDENIASIINGISGDGNRILLFEDITSAFSNKHELKYQSKDSDINNTNSKDTNKKYTDSDSDVYSDSDTNKKKPKNSSSNPTSTKFLTYSGLLNSLDGVTSGCNGTIFIMTTNHIEELGDALIRPGRIDFCLELSYCDKFQIIEMTENMINKSYEIINKVGEKNKLFSKMIFNNPYSTKELKTQIELFANNIIKNKSISIIKPCELQVYILKYIDNVPIIFSNYQELLNKKYMGN